MCLLGDQLTFTQNNLCYLSNDLIPSATCRNFAMSLCSRAANNSLTVFLLFLLLTRWAGRRVSLLATLPPVAADDVVCVVVVVVGPLKRDGSSSSTKSRENPESNEGRKGKRYYFFSLSITRWLGIYFSYGDLLILLS